MIVDVPQNIWADKRSWDDGATTFFLVHLVLVAVSLVLGTAIGWLGVRGLLAGRRYNASGRSGRPVVAESGTTR